MKKLTSALLLVVFVFQLVGINAFASESQYNGSESTSNLDEVIAICKKYSDGNTVTGVRNQIDWLNQLYNAISQDFVGQLGLGETLLIALLNHTDINTTLLTSSYSTGDINREVAKIILIGAEGYADVASIAKATELKETDVRDILESIVAGGITEKTIANGKDSNSATNRGTYVKNQALKQEKVWQYLITEVARMTENPDSMAILCQDLGAGYVSNMMSGQEPDKYKVSLYKKYLAKTLDAVLDSDTPSIVSYDITKADTYKVAKKTRSVLSKIFSYEVGAEKDALPEELKAFWDEHLKNGVLSESEAREYLILSGEYQKGEHGIGEAAKQLVKGYKHLKRFKTVLDKTGKVFDAVDKLKKADEFLEYWATDYAEQEIMLDYLVESLSQSGADLDMMTAARELQQEYNDKLAVTFDKVYVAMIGKGVGTLKSAFPPLQIAESVISLSATVTGADKKVGALETGLAMQGICSQALDDYEKAVIAVNEGDTSEEAASRVLSTFKIAKQSMILYCKAMIELAETDAQKEAYSSDLQKLEQAEFGYSAISLPFGGGGGGSRNGNADLTQFAENQKPVTSSDEKAIEATVTSNIAVLEDGYYKVAIPVEYIVQATDGSYKALVCVFESKPVCFSSEEVQNWKVGDIWSRNKKVITDLFWDDYGWLVMNNEYCFKPYGDGTYVLCSYNSPSLAEWWTDYYQYTASVTIPENTVTRAAGPGYPVTAQCVLELFDDSFEIHGFTPVYDALCANEISFWSTRINVENGICTSLSIPDAHGAGSILANEYARIEDCLDNLKKQWYESDSTDGATSSHSEEAVLAIGDYVKFGNDRTWQVIHLGENTATLFHQGCFSGVFDASLHMEAHAISLMNYRTYGSATWEYSDVRQWLNAREASESALDVAFDYSNLAQGFSGMGMQATVKKESGSYAYAGKAGFLSAENFTDLEYWLLEPTQNTSCVPYTQIVTSVVNGVSSFKNFQAEMDKLYSEEIGQTQTIDRMFLLNGREIKEYLIDNGLSPYVSTSGSTYPAYWLRDAVYHGLANYYHYYGTNILTVANKGAGSQQADLEAFIRPACNINLSYVTGVSGAGTSEDPYTLTIDSSVINRPISLVDDTENTTTAEPVADFTAFEAVFQHTANKVDKELALQSAMASNKAYNKQGIFDYLVSLGFDKDSIVQEDYESTATHSVAITMAQREVVDENGTPKTLYALIIRGTNSTLEWVSNFDIGTSSVSKGFDKAASRVMGYFAKYVKNHAPLDGSFTDGNYLVWTCGHSRGAAVANLIAGKYLPMYLASDNVYAYTFATPNVDRDATICKNIVNFVIQGDLVPRVPFREWGFERYGLTINYTNDELNGITLNTNRSTTMLSTLLTDRVKTQEEYAKTTKELLQVLESEAETKEVDLEFMVKGLFSTVYSVGTVSDIIVKMDVYEDLSMLLNMIGTDINTDELFFTTEDFFDALSLIGPTHSMDTYLEWMKQ